MLQQKCHILLNSPDFLDLMYLSGQELTSVQPKNQSDEPEPKTPCWCQLGLQPQLSALTIAVMERTLLLWPLRADWRSSGSWFGVEFISLYFLKAESIMYNFWAFWTSQQTGSYIPLKSLNRVCSYYYASFSAFFLLNWLTQLRNPQNLFIEWGKYREVVCCQKEPRLIKSVCGVFIQSP